MTGWRKQAVGDLPLYQARVMAGLPRTVQGFTTRSGGVSRPPYDTLNLGAHVGDDAGDVGENRRRIWADLGFGEAQVALAAQVHRDGVAVVTEGTGAMPLPGVDALVSDTPDVLLMLFFADCVPVYFVDPTRKAVGLAHAGWRGAASGIAAKTLWVMGEAFGSRPGDCLAALGPCIGGDSYEVGGDVADRFRSLPGARAANAVAIRSEMGGTYTLNLRQVLFGQLLTAGVRAEAIAVCDEDTYRNRRDFFSYRRDGPTGRMAAFVGIRGGKPG